MSISSISPASLNYILQQAAQTQNKAAGGQPLKISGAQTAQSSFTDTLNGVLGGAGIDGVSEQASTTSVQQATDVASSNAASLLNILV